MVTRRYLLLCGTTTFVVSCTSSKTGTVTTVVLNVASWNAWGQALVSAAQLVSVLPGIPPQIAVPIQALGPEISGAMSAFNTAAAGQITLTVDTSSPVNVASTLEADAERLLSDTEAAVPNVASTQVTQAKEYLAAIETIVALLQAAMSTNTAAAVSFRRKAVMHMSEERALKVLHRR